MFPGGEAPVQSARADSGTASDILQRRFGAVNIAAMSTGSIGGTPARYLTAASHHVTIANRRGPQRLSELAAETGAHPAGIPDVAQTRFAYVKDPEDLAAA